MTNLEINTKIAEIEGVELFHSYSNLFDKKKLVAMYMDTGVKWVRAGESEESFFTKVYSLPSEYKGAEYSMISDKTLCFDLMIKHGVMAESVNGKITRFVLPFKNKEGKMVYHRFEDEVPQRAIGMCIIYKAENEEVI